MMNGAQINTAGMVTINTTMNASMMSDAMSDPPSSPESAPFDESDLLNSAVTDDVTAQLAAAGPIGVAAAAAVATGKMRKRPYSFETNPSIRKRQQTRLLRKLKSCIDEYTTRVGQQAVVLCCTPGKSNSAAQSFKVFGSQPLENVMRNCRGVVVQDLETALAQQAPPPQGENPQLHELPPLNIDGLPTPVDKMTQAQLRAFIPEMLKYSTGRSKPGWGKPESRPIWWPDDVPWANVRSDVRSEDQKKKVSWTHALRTIVRNCYKHHGREDLLPDFASDDAIVHHTVQTGVSGGGGGPFAQTMVQTINNPDGTVSIIQIDTGEHGSPQIVTLSDGTQAQVVPIHGHSHPQHEATQAVQTLAEVAATHQDTGLQQTVSVEMANDGSTHHAAVATVNQDGQLILTGDTSGLTGMVTIPVSMYHTVVTNLQQVQEMQQQQQQQQQQHFHAQNIHVAMAPIVSEPMDHTVTVTQPDELTPGMLKREKEHDDLEDQDDLHDPSQGHQNSDVPDATQAIEVMTVDQSQGAS